MTHPIPRFVTRAGFTFAVLAVLWLLLIMAAPARAQGMSEERIGPSLAGLGAGGYLIILAGLGAVLTTVMGAATARRADTWPHWRALTHGLGEAAFLFGILFTMNGIRMGLQEIARLGAAVTPADLSVGLGTACTTLVLASLAALVSLLGAGVIRLAEGRGAAEE